MITSYKKYIENIIVVNTENLKRFAFTFKNNIETAIIGDFIRDLKSDDIDLGTVDTVVPFNQGEFTDILVCDYFQNDETKNVKPKKIIRELTLNFAEKNFFNKIFIENVLLEENKDSFKIILEFYLATKINYYAIVNVLVAYNIKSEIKIESSEFLTEDLKETEKITCTIVSKEMTENLKEVLSFIKKMKIRKYETLKDKEKNYLRNNIHSNTTSIKIREKEALLVNKI